MATCSLDKTVQQIITEYRRRNRTIADVMVERERQQQLWGGTSGEVLHPDTTDEHRLAILAEEFGEVAKEVCEGNPTGNLRTELIQTAAVAIAWAEALSA